MKLFAAIFAHVVSLDHAQAVRTAFEENANADLMNALQTRANVSTSMDNLQDDSHRHSELNARSNGMKRLFLLGPPDSGTNLLERSLILNWERQWKKQYVSGVWKHSMSDNDSLFKLLANGSDMSDALILIMVRSPIAQMVSWYKAPYILKTCFGNLSTVDQPCSVHACAKTQGAIYPNVTNPNFCIQPNLDRWPENVPETRLFPLGTFDSSVEVYNSYLRQYRALQQDSRFPHVLLVPYESLVYNPEAELGNIAKQMAWQIPKTISALASKSKNHAHEPCKNREQALKYLTSRSWLEHTDTDVLASMCKLLDREAVQGLYEGSETDGSPGNARPYSFDCSTGSPPHASEAA